MGTWERLYLLSKSLVMATFSRSAPSNQCRRPLEWIVHQMPESGRSLTSLNYVLGIGTPSQDLIDPLDEVLLVSHIPSRAQLQQDEVVGTGLVELFQNVLDVP